MARLVVTFQDGSTRDWLVAGDNGDPRDPDTVSAAVQAVQTAALFFNQVSKGRIILGPVREQEWSDLPQYVSINMEDVRSVELTGRFLAGQRGDQAMTLFHQILARIADSQPS
jgi:hypothetical protein